MKTRIHVPGREPEYVDLGPSEWIPLHGHATLRGHIVTPAPMPLSESGERSRRFRERHGGRRAVQA